MNTSAKNIARHLLRLTIEAGFVLVFVVMAVAKVNQYPYFGVAAIAFAPQVTYPVGTGPFSVTTLDFNGDGVLDLIVPNRDSGNLTALRGEVGGTFTPLPEALHGGNCPIFAVSADFNGDTKSDLAVINHLCATLFVSLGNGDGTFTNETSYPTADEPRSITVGDFNNDTFDDLAIANRLSGTISIFNGVGDGTFQPRVDYPAGLSPHAIIAGDLNGDNWVDLAVANTGTDSVTIFQNLGQGIFRSVSDIPAGAGSTELVMTDLNRDGNIDIAVVNVVLGGVSVMIGNGDFTFGSLRQYPTGGNPFDIRTADFNGDGNPDLVVANRNANNVTVLLGTGDGTFAPVTHLNNFATGISPYDVIVADFNGDGRSDIVTANFVDNTISVLLSENPSFADLVISNSASTPIALAATDLTYTIQVTNQGPDPAINVLVTDPLPAKVAFVSCVATDGGVCAQNSGARTITFPVLNPGVTATITIAVRTLDTVCDGDQMINTAQVSARTPDPYVENNSATDTVAGANAAPQIKPMAGITMIGVRPGSLAGPAINYQAPAATDNTSGTIVSCTRPIGAVFPVGLTTVTCTATDICGMTATTTFDVRVWDVILIDDYSRNIFLFDSFTGNYLFKRMDTGQEYFGSGKIYRIGCDLRLLDDKRADVTINRCLLRGSGTYRTVGTSPVFTIRDRYTLNNDLTGVTISTTR